MNSKITSVVTVLLMSITMNLHAQSDSTTIDSTANTQIIMDDSVHVRNNLNAVKQQIPHNLIKVNLTALLFKSYSIQYERVLNRKFSIAVQYRTMPETGIPFKSTVLKLVGDDDADTKKIIEDFRISNFAITPEVRLYLKVGS